MSGIVGVARGRLRISRVEGCVNEPVSPPSSVVCFNQVEKKSILELGKFIDDKDALRFLFENDPIEEFKTFLVGKDLTNFLPEIVSRACEVFDTHQKVSSFCASLNFRGKVPTDFMIRIRDGQGVLSEKLFEILVMLHRSPSMSIKDLILALDSFPPSKSLEDCCEKRYELSELKLWVSNMKSTDEFMEVRDKLDAFFPTQLSLVRFCVCIDHIRQLPVHILRAVLNDECRLDIKFMNLALALRKKFGFTPDMLLKAIESFENGDYKTLRPLKETYKRYQGLCLFYRD